MKNKQPLKQQSLEKMRLPASERVDPESASHDELLSALEAAKTGVNPKSALALMQELLVRIRSGDRSITPILENWISHAFGKILEDGFSADQAFGIKSRAGKYQRPNTVDRDIVATASVILLMRSHKNWEDAVGDVANLLFADGQGDRAVKEAYSKYRDELSIFPSEYLKSLTTP